MHERNSQTTDHAMERCVAIGRIGAISRNNKDMDSVRERPFLLSAA